MKDQTTDKWEMTSNDVTIYEDLGHGAFGKDCKGIMKASLCIKRVQSVNITSKKILKSTITVAVKMLQGMLNAHTVIGIKSYCKFACISYLKHLFHTYTQRNEICFANI